ncbi:hypothetical protein LR48_Vigan09g052200 [Vigna angularis]|uniref:Uncharacterized protein n=1 Tax=Phaseolus angularis TaxID=3914 RepID=A0A0L9VA30_PHAAN|nr:hypothetical protein LR48_Vigan09g052200 [Vigna angularis]
MIPVTKPSTLCKNTIAEFAGHQIPNFSFTVGLSSALNVTSAKVEKLEITIELLTLRSVSIVQTEPIVVHITFDLVLEENSDFDASLSLNYFASSVASTKGSGYGFADKV